jgi:NDP-sugar pyrophosphorylase family protein
VGDPSRYLGAQKDLLSLDESETFRETLSDSMENPSYIASTAKIGESARFGPFASAGPGCVIEEGSIVENSILWENVHVKSGASIRNCIAGSGVTLQGDVRDLIVTRYGEAPIVGASDSPKTS